ncbi:MAG: UvrD-helicase domain-containing protein [Pseudomonadota bacterium]
MPDPGIRDDIEARATALDAQSSFIIQAPAGSGKTELLIQRYLTLLAGVDNPEEVLAITFTNKAAAEMRHRVLSALGDAISDDEPEAEHLKLTRGLARAVLDRDASKDWNLTRNAGRLRIQTLDSFNALLARMEPLTASVSTSGTAIPGDAELKRLYRDAAAATLEYLDGPEEWADSVAGVLTHMDCNVSLYIDRLAEMLVSRDQWLPLIGGKRLSDTESDAVRRSLEADLEAMVDDTLSAARAALPSDRIPELLAIARFASATLNDEGRDSPIRALQGLSELPDASWRQLMAWQGLADLLLTKDGNPRSRLSIAEGFPPGKGDGQAMKARLKDLLIEFGHDNDCLAMLHAARTLPEPRYPDDQWTVLRALLDLLKLATGELKRLFRSRGASDYIEISQGAAAALGDEQNPTDLGLVLDYRMRHILVDEVQDTSLAQYRMLERLVAGWSPGDGRTLFCVGDPMQSIYRFRNADVAQFLVAREQGIGEQSLASLTLRQNFRSGEGLVDWYNRTFERVMPQQDDPPRGAVSYAKAVSPAGLQGFGGVTVHPVLGSSERHEAISTVNAVQNLLDTHPDDRIVILVRGRTQLRELVPALRHRAIAFNAVDIDTLTELPESLELMSLARAIAHPGDRQAWLGVLRAPWIGLDFDDLARLVTGDRQSLISDLLGDPERLATLSPEGRAAIERAGPFLRALREPIRAGSLRDRVETLWLQQGGPTWLADKTAVDNAYHFLRVLSGIEESGSLSDVALLGSQLDAEKVSSASDTARVEIMTMHKSKGLQFDHVVLHGIGRTTKGDASKVLNWIESTSRDGEERLLLAPVGRADSIDRDPIHAYLAFLNRDKSRFELQRLLYVACTRARKTLQLIGHVGVDTGAAAIKTPASGSLLALLWPIVEPEYQQALSRGDTVRQEDSDVEWLTPIRRQLLPDWTPPAISHERLLGSARPGDAEQIRYEWAGSDAKFAGTLVHRWLQVWTEGQRLDCLDDARRRDDITRRWLRAGSYDDAERVLSRVNRALDGVRDDPRGRWLLAGDGHAELALTGVVDDRIVTGVIDRIRVEGDEHWVVDYKTSDHEGGNRAFFLREEVRRYREQLARYVHLYGAWAGVRPRAALYFPLMGEFVEVDEL